MMAMAALAVVGVVSDPCALPSLRTEMLRVCPPFPNLDLDHAGYLGSIWIEGGEAPELPMAPS